MPKRKPQRDVVLDALARAGDGASAREVTRKIHHSRRTEVRGTAQTLRRAADDGLVTREGAPGAYRYRRLER